MSEKITREMICQISELARLRLNSEEILQAQHDMQQMLDYAELLEQLNTDGTEPMVQPICYENIFRSDAVSECGTKGEILFCAPRAQSGQYLVPITVENGGNENVSEE